MRKIGRNAIYNVVGTAAGLAVLLIATPIYLKYLGLEQFGIFTLIASLTAPLAVLNAGVSQAGTKFVAQHIAAGDYDTAAAFARHAAVLNVLFGLLGLVILWFLAPWLATTAFQI